MAGILFEIFRTRTIGNGHFQQASDHEQFEREITAFLAEGFIVEVACPARKNVNYPVDRINRRFRDLQTGDTYEYFGPAEVTERRFCKVSPD